MEFADFDPSPKEPTMTKTTMSLADLLEKHDEGDFLRAVAEAAHRQHRGDNRRGREHRWPPRE